LPAPWQRHPVTQLIVGIIGVAPLYLLSIISAVQSMITGETPAPAPAGSIFATLLYVAIFGAWLIVLLYFVCGEGLGCLQLKPGQVWGDVKNGIALGFTLLSVALVFGSLAGWLSQEGLPPTNRAIANALASDNLLLIIWLGPVVWLQAAVLEEFYRTFLLTRMWRVWPSHAGMALTVIGSALLFGLGHAYQGPFGMVGTGLIGLVLGWHYLHHGRVLPLIIAHGLYDSCVLLGMVLFVRHGLI
jgi:membrane protease YdiL (CAAX protease family)